MPARPNDLWQSDVTCVHTPGCGWSYLITVIDYYSCYLLAVRFTNSYSAQEAIPALGEARAEAERLRGPLESLPFLVTDNGSSFIAHRFAAHVRDLSCHVRIQYWTPTQLGLLERFHQTLKVEEVYWRLCDDPRPAQQCLAEFRQRYNQRRPHWALRPTASGDPVAPADVYARCVNVQIPKSQGWARAAKARLDDLMAA